MKFIDMEAQAIQSVIDQEARNPYKSSFLTEKNKKKMEALEQNTAEYLPNKKQDAIAAEQLDFKFFKGHAKRNTLTCFEQHEVVQAANRLNHSSFLQRDTIDNMKN